MTENIQKVLDSMVEKDKWDKESYEFVVSYKTAEDNGFPNQYMGYCIRKDITMPYGIIYLCPKPTSHELQPKQ